MAVTARNSLSQSLAVQGRVLHACMMREVITRFGRHNIGVLWLVAEPMLFTLGVAGVWYAMRLNHVSDIPIIAFAITGYSSVLGWRNSATRCVMAINANRSLLFHRNVRVIDVLLTRSLLEIGGATASFALLTFAFASMDWMTLPSDALVVVIGWVLLSWFGIALGMTIGALTTYSDVVEKLWTPTSYLLFPLSGAAYMVEWLPDAARQYVLLLPMVHGVEMIRDGFFGNVVRTHYDVGYLLAGCLLMSLLGLLLCRGAGRRVGDA
jgi:capsular polysaccharide transport system permease protein